MWIKFLCWAYGHNIMLKAMTGRVIKVIEKDDTYAHDVPLYKWEKQKNCVRCGKEVI